MVCVVVGVGLLHRRARMQHIMLLGASYLFYGWWDVRFLILILLSTVIDYAAALGMEGTKLSHWKRFALSITMLLGIGFFLIPDWPAIQGAGAGLGSIGEHLVARWDGIWWSVGLLAMFALLGPLLYGQYFRLGDRARKRAFLTTSIVANLGLLGFFKYFNFFTDGLVGLGSLAGLEFSAPVIRVALPVGISFYTFQTMSYTIDAYRGKIRAEHSFVRMALYVAYFPQLVAGPILRPQQFFPYLERAWVLRGAQICSGFNLIAIGLFKKVMIADWVGPLADVVFNAPEGHSSLVIIIAAAMFAIQIYCDFSGYTDIARGVSRMFGVEIPLNFDFPYFSTSIIEFWRRWHISLSTWLRDYLYISLGGNRFGVGRMYFNLMITMVLGGLWHGASWNFVLWGAYQGVLLVLNRFVRHISGRVGTLGSVLNSRVGTALRWAVTAYFWLLGWVIFRVTDFGDLWYCLKRYVLFDFDFNIFGSGLGKSDPAIAFLAAGVFVVLHSIGFFSKRWGERLDAMPLLVRFVLYALLGFVFFYAWPSGNTAFIYFQF